MTTATFHDTWAGDVVATLTPMKSDKTRFWWMNPSGCVCAGQARALPKARAIAYAKWHRSFSNVVED